MRCAASTVSGARVTMLLLHAMKIIGQSVLSTYLHSFRSFPESELARDDESLPGSRGLVRCPCLSRSSKQLVSAQLLASGGVENFLHLHHRPETFLHTTGTQPKHHVVLIQSRQSPVEPISQRMQVVRNLHCVVSPDPLPSNQSPNAVTVWSPTHHHDITLLELVHMRP